MSVTYYNLVPWSLLKMFAPQSDLSLISLSADVLLFCTCCSNCGTLIHLSILLLNATLSSLTNIPCMELHQIRLASRQNWLQFLVFNASPFYIHFSFLEFVLVKRVFKPNTYWAAQNQGIYCKSLSQGEGKWKRFCYVTTIYVASGPMTHYASPENGFCEYAFG